MAPMKNKNRKKFFKTKRSQLAIQRNHWAVNWIQVRN